MKRTLVICVFLIIISVVISIGIVVLKPKLSFPVAIISPKSIPVSSSVNPKDVGANLTLGPASPGEFVAIVGLTTPLLLYLQTTKDISEINITLLFDKALFTITDAELGFPFKDLVIKQKTIDNAIGKVYFEATASPRFANGALLKLALKPIKQGTGSITIDEKSFVMQSNGQKLLFTIPPVFTFPISN